MCFLYTESGLTRLTRGICCRFGASKEDFCDFRLVNMVDLIIRNGDTIDDDQYFPEQHLPGHDV